MTGIAEYSVTEFCPPEDIRVIAPYEPVSARAISLPSSVVLPE
jgi:hypothetical protein